MLIIVHHQMVNNRQNKINHALKKTTTGRNGLSLGPVVTESTAIEGEKQPNMNMMPNKIKKTVLNNYMDTTIHYRLDLPAMYDILLPPTAPCLFPLGFFYNKNDIQYLVCSFM